METTTMRTKTMALTACLLTVLLVTAGAVSAAGKDARTIACIAGGRSHGYGTHEHYAAFTLLAKTLRDVPGVRVVVHRGWPKDDKALADADALVLNCDGGGGHLLKGRVDEVEALVRKGVGLALLHYATGVPKEAVGLTLDTVGGYWQSGYSANPIWVAEVTALPDHPIARGVRPFALKDEWYYGIRFREGEKGVVPILSAVPPDAGRRGKPHLEARKGQPETLAWVRERPDGGRGFGFTGLHWHWNLAHDDFRRLLLNAMVWTAGAEVPEGGVPSERPTVEDLTHDLDEQPPKNWDPATVRKWVEAFGRPSPAK
jgi:hypothetical protein